MKKIINFLPLFAFFVLLLVACSKNGRIVVLPDNASDNAKENVNKNKGGSLSGDVSTVETRVYISGYNAIANKYLFDWSKTKTRPMRLFFKQAKSAGTKIENYAGTPDTISLKVNADGSCTFSGVTTPSWFVFGRDSVAGAIAGAGTTNSPAPAYTTTAGEWTFTQPSTIDKGGDYYLPMYFPPTVTVSTGTGTGKVFASFQMLGSMLAIEVNNTSNTARVRDYFYLRSQSTRMRGTTSFADAYRVSSTVPGFTNSVGSDTSRYFKINNLTVPANKKDTFYLWVNQNSNLKREIISNIGTGADSTNRSLFYRSDADRASAALFENGKFYMLRHSAATPSNLVFTELAEPDYNDGCFIEIYNGTDSAVQLNNYFIYELVSKHWERIPSYVLGSKKVVVLATPPPGATPDYSDPTFVRDIARVTGDILYFSPASRADYGNPKWQFRDFTLTKFKPDFNLVIDRINSMGDPNFNWYTAKGMKRKVGFDSPNAYFNWQQWYEYPDINWPGSEDLGSRN